MRRGPARATRTDTRFPYTTRFRSTAAVDPVEERDLRLRRRSPRAARRLLERSCRRARRAGRANRCRQEQPRHLIGRSEEHTSELQSLMRISYAVFCLKKKKPEIMTH